MNIKNFLNKYKNEVTEIDDYLYEPIEPQKKSLKLFILWWIQAVLLCFCAIVLNYFNIWHFLYDADKTNISFIIIFLFILSTITTGILSYINEFYTYKNFQDYLWLANDTLINLGLIGTVAGFMLMFGTAFLSLDVSDIESVKKAIIDMGFGMSTALLTTLIGLITSILLKIQLVIIESSLFSKVDPYDPF